MLSIHPNPRRRTVKTTFQKADNHMGSALLPHHIAPEQGGAHVIWGEAEVVALRAQKIMDAEVVIL